MKYNIIDLLNAILKEAGLTSIMDDSLDQYSTIAMKMKENIPDIYIKTIDDEVWIWSVLGDYNISTLSYLSENLFSILFNYHEEVFYIGHPCLYPIENSLELRALIKEKMLVSPEAFMNVLDSYLVILQEYCSVLK